MTAQHIFSGMSFVQILIFLSFEMKVITWSPTENTCLRYKLSLISINIQQNSLKRIDRKQKLHLHNKNTHPQLTLSF